MRVARKKKRNRKIKLTAVCSTPRRAVKRYDSEDEMTTMAKSVSGKRNVTEIGGLTIDKNYGTFTSLGYFISYMHADQYCTLV